MRKVILLAILALILISFTVIGASDYITIDLNSTKVWWEDGVNASGYAQVNDSPFDGWIQVNRSNALICNLTTSNGYYSCTFTAPTELGTYTYTAYALDSDASILAQNSSQLTVALTYGERTPKGNIAIYKIPVMIQELSGKIRTVWAQVKVWF